MDDPPAGQRYRFAIQGGSLADPVALREEVQTIEALGYDEFYTSDHIGRPGSDGRHGGMFVVEPFSPLLIAAAATERLRVGPLVLNAELYNPALLARHVATVDRLSSGRLVLGLGTGYAAAEHDAIGMPIRPPGPRVTRFGEVLHILRGLLDDGALTFDGEHESIKMDDLGIEPQQERVPFLIGGHGRRVVRLAGQYADVFQFTGLTHGEGGAPTAGGFALVDLVERSRLLTEAAGARDGQIERSALVQITGLGDDALTMEQLSERLRLDPEVIADTPFVLCGSVEQVVDKIERLRETLGITHYVVRDAEGFAPVLEALRS